MKFNQTDYTGTIDILANDHYVGVPIKVDAAAANGDGIALAGTPMAKDGTKATDATAYGILLFDVRVSDNPNGTVVIHGFIETKKAKDHSGVTVTDEMKATMPLVMFN